MLGGLVRRLTTTVSIKAIGKAITIESTVGHGAVATNTVLPVINLQMPKAPADSPNSKTSQKILANDPTTNPVITPALVEHTSIRMQQQLYYTI